MNKRNNGAGTLPGIVDQPSGRDYEVGYCRPPKHCQFKPGKSGNPKGRPKKIHNLEATARRCLMQKVSLIEGGKRRTVTALEALVRQLMDQALRRGDYKAVKLLIDLAGTHLPRVDVWELFKDNAHLVSKEEIATLEAIFGKLARRVGLH